MWLIELGFHNYFILKRYRFLTGAIFIGSALRPYIREENISNLIGQSNYLQKEFHPYINKKVILSRNIKINRIKCKTLQVVIYLEYDKTMKLKEKERKQLTI